MRSILTLALALMLAGEPGTAKTMLSELLSAAISGNASIRPAEKSVLPQALANLDTRTLKRLDADLAKLISALKADGRAANIPLGQ